MHVSNTDLTLASDIVISNLPFTVDVYTANGGFLIIDSGANFRYGYLELHGGNSAVNDLEINNSSFRTLFSANNWSNIHWDSSAKARFTGSALGGYEFASNNKGGMIYADNCVFTTIFFSPGGNSIDTIINTQIHDDINVQGLRFHVGRNASFFSSNVQVSAFNQMDFYTSGSVLNGNVSCDYPNSFFTFNQEDPARPLPNIINGNLTVREDCSVGIAGDVKISGNFENISVPQAVYPDTAHVFINGQDIFEVGGIVNYRSNLFVTNCVQNFCHFNLEFYGSTNSNILWPIGFPIDTLIINKTGCAKVTATHSLYVSGQAKIKAGQLVLDPNAGVPYKFVCAGDLNIYDGGGIFLRRDPAGVANMAIAGDINDYNNVVDSNCTGLSNLYNGSVTLYNELQHPSAHQVNIPGSSNIGNLNLIGQQGLDFTLGRNLTVNNLDFVNPARVVLANNNLVVNGTILHYGLTSYAVTNGTGYLQINNVGTIATTFPVGTSTSYTPATLTNMGLADNFDVNIQPLVLSDGSTGTPYIAGAVNQTWNINKATTGPADVTLNLQWNAADELTGFKRNNAYISHYSSGAWENGTLGVAIGLNPFAFTRTGLTSFSPFAVMSPAAIVPITLLDFTGTYRDKGIVLNWSTKTEFNTSYYTLEKSTDALGYKPLTTIRAFGNSQVPRRYSYVDEELTNFTNYYRLKITDFNGSKLYSKTIAVKSPEDKFISIFPNPVEKELKIHLNGSTGITTLHIINASGSTVRILRMTAGTATGSFDVSSLPAGYYTILIDPGTSKQRLPFLKR